MIQTELRPPLPPFTRETAINASDRKFHWLRDNNGRRPDDHAGLSALEL